VGSEHKIALQTMTTTDTRDVAKTVEQVPWACAGEGVCCAMHLWTWKGMAAG
jgi:4-hydroxy-3-methylbut-2-en-1-yl diphosphate synthase IspG/GcpE